MHSAITTSRSWCIELFRCSRREKILIPLRPLAHILRSSSLPSPWLQFHPESQPPAATHQVPSCSHATPEYRRPEHAPQQSSRSGDPDLLSAPLPPTQPTHDSRGCLNR